MIEIKLSKEEDFLKIKETLTRIGIAQSNIKTLHQSCHILHKSGRYYITHFKELLASEGGVEPTNMTEEDYKRLYVITGLLRDWNLCKVLDELPEVNEKITLSVIPFKDKGNWILKQKYNLGGE